MRMLMVVLVLLLVACGGGEGEPETQTDGADPTAAEEQSGPPETQAPAVTQAPGGDAAAAGAGSVIATIGDQTWEFDSATCFIIEGTPGEEGSVWKVTNSDAFQVVLESGNNVDGIAVGGGPFSDDEENDWDTNAPVFEVNGSTVIGSGTFINRVNDESAEGTVTAVCPDWG